MKCPECNGSGQMGLTINSGTLVKGANNWLPNVRGRRRTSFWSQLLISVQLVVARCQQAIAGVKSIKQRQD